MNRDARSFENSVRNRVYTSSLPVERPASLPPHSPIHSAVEARYGHSYANLPFAAPTAQRVEEPTPNRTGLPDHVKSGIEAQSGISLNDVKVHYNSNQPAQLEALAYTQGTDIHVAPGQEQHVPHEAWHVVQQKQGRVQPTLSLNGTAINDDAGLEREADMMGRAI